MRYLDAAVTQHYHSLLRDIANVNKQVAISPGLVGSLDSQLRGTIQ